MAHVGTMARAYRFGRFVLEPDRRCLSVDGAPVPLGSRAFDILQMLIERRDTVVSRDDILSHVWRGTVVEGNTLAVQISALRRALGEPPMIATVAGRGYRFVGQVLDETDLPPELPGASLSHFLPPPTPVPIAARTPRRWPAAAMGLLALLACALFVGRKQIFGPPHVAPRLSIVVLPFRNLGHDPEQDYLADAISDDLTTDLSHIPGSVVIARTSADSYKGRAVPSGDIGRALDVRYVLEGSLMAEGKNLHINAQLIDAPTGAHLWANAFDVPRDKLGEARAQIVNHIGSALNVTLVDVASARSVADHPTKPDAVDLFLRARSLLDHVYTLGSLSDAQSLLERAVAIEPNYADALAELGRVLTTKIKDFDDPDPNETIDHERAKWAITRAIDLAPQSPQALTASGYLSWLNGRCAEAEPTFQKALTLDQNELRARVGLARCAHVLGHIDEMLSNLLEMARLDPLGADVPIRQNMIGTAYLLLGQPRAALEWLNRAGAGLAHTEDQPSVVDAEMWRRSRVIAAMQLTGETAKAHLSYEHFAKIWPNVTAWRLGSYETKVTASLPGHVAFLRALEAAGMPAFADEHKDFGISTSTYHEQMGDFQPTPSLLQGGTVIDTLFLRQLVERGDQNSPPKPQIIDVGSGASVIPGAVWTWAQDAWADQQAAVLAAARDAEQAGRGVVIMGDGPFGGRSYDAAIALVKAGFQNVMWYRGGEEAWAASGLPSVDRRTP